MSKQPDEGDPPPRAAGKASGNRVELITPAIAKDTPVGVETYANSRRMEKSLRLQNADLTEYNLLECDLVRPKVKAAECHGKEAHLKFREREHQLVRPGERQAAVVRARLWLPLLSLYVANSAKIMLLKLSYKPI